MNRTALILIVIGLAAGTGIGYFTTDYLNHREVNSTAQGQPGMGGAQGAMPAAVLEILAKAKKEPDNFDYQLQAAEMYFQVGKLDQSVEFLNRALKLKPNDETVLTNLTAVLLQKGDKAEAEKTFALLEKTKPATDELKQRRDEMRQQLKEK